MKTRKPQGKVPSANGGSVQRLVRRHGGSEQPMFPNEVPASRGDMITELLSWRERAAKAWWITDTLPDDEMTVLMRLNDNEYPVCPGFRDDGEWRTCDGTTVVGPVRGWMQLEDAALALDGRVPPNDQSSATRPTRAFDCNQSAMAGFAAAHGGTCLIMVNKECHDYPRG